MGDNHICMLESQPIGSIVSYSSVKILIIPTGKHAWLIQSQMYEKK